jgi:hypothetical protein
MYSLSAWLLLVNDAYAKELTVVKWCCKKGKIKEFISK